VGTIKTKVHDASVNDFINSVAHEQRKKDAFVLLDLFKKITKMEPKMWGPTMIGFGSYHYKSERSSQEGDWPLTAFSPRKQALTIYIMTGFDGYSEQLKKLGKHKTSVGCLYINKLDDVDMKVLEDLIRTTFKKMKKKL
jgi:hypothetical protein